MLCPNKHIIINPASSLRMTMMEAYYADKIICQSCDLVVKDRWDSPGRYELKYKNVIEHITPLPYDPQYQATEFLMWFCPSLSYEEASELKNIGIGIPITVNGLKKLIEDNIVRIRQRKLFQFEVQLPPIPIPFTEYKLQNKQETVEVLQKLSTLSVDNFQEIIACEEDIQQINKITNELLNNIKK